MKKKKVDYKSNLLILIILLLIISSLILIMSFKTIHKYNIWKEHKDYFKQDLNKQKIKDWMTIYYIEKKYNINIENELNISLSFFDKRDTLNELCLKRKLNCSKIINDLNNKYKRIN